MGEALRQQYGQPEAVLLAAQAYPEVHKRAQLEMMKFLGGVAIRGEAEAPSYEAKDTEDHGSSLMAAAQLAALGDQESLKTVETNVATELSERLFKVANQTEVKLHMQNGRLGQNGRQMIDLHRNALEQTELNPEMVRRSSYEARNIFAFEQLFSRGLLKKFDIAIFSTAPTNMTEAEKKDYRFFTDTESVSIQRFSAEGDEVTLQTAFVAGKKTPNSERHDLQTIAKMAHEGGVVLPETTDGTEMLQHIFLIPKQQITGVEDIVAWYDAAAGGTFYGESKPQQDYRQYAKKCRRRAAQFGDVVANIRDQLLSEAHTFTSPLQAFMRLDALSERACTERAVFDETIDLRIFGEEATKYIFQARQHYTLGEFEMFHRALDKAVAVGESGSCPIKRGIVSGGSGGGPAGEGVGAAAGVGETTRKIRMNCPYCKAEVFDDPCASRLSCQDCKALVVSRYNDPDTKIVISTGNGGSRKRREEWSKLHSTKLMDIILQPKQSQQTAAGQQDFALAA